MRPSSWFRPRKPTPAPAPAPARAPHPYFRFVPKPDITAFELAEILTKIVPSPGAIPMLYGVFCRPGVEPEGAIGRHFRPEPPPFLIFPE